MGNSFSEPVNADPTLGYVGMILGEPNKIRLLHAPQEVFTLAKKVIKEVNIASEKDEDVIFNHDYGITEITLGTKCFSTGHNITSATSGKLFTIRMLEEMHQLGYDPVVSSDLERSMDNTTWIFVKRQAGRSAIKVTCLSPGGLNKLIMLRADDKFTDTVRSTVENSWSRGIKSEKKYEACGETLTKIKVGGGPWGFTCAGCYDDRVCGCYHDRVNSGNMMLDILIQLGAINYKLIFVTRVKGLNDSFFFIQDPTYTISKESLCMISLYKTDRLRLVNCVNMADTLREVIEYAWGPIQKEEEIHDTWEFKLEGRPWREYDDNAIRARRLISRISETMLKHGWALSGAIDLSKMLEDTSCLLYTRVPPISAHIGCIALRHSEEETVCFLDFPPSHTDAMKEALAKAYLPGIKKENQRENCLQLELNGEWSGNNQHNIHARSALLHLLKIANYLGWHLVAAADVSCRITNTRHAYEESDLDSWYLVSYSQESKGATSAESKVATSTTEGKKDLYPALNSPPSYQDAKNMY